MPTPLLDRIRGPKTLRRLTPEQLPALAAELREEILQVVSRLGGHLASSLGAVELVIALHYLFDAPRDRIVWDMGYQAYAHKLLTGRRELFQALKQHGGASGFCHRQESPYDCFTTGHGGTALSTALGWAMARDLAGEDYKVVAVMGDASLGEGMALEALNHAGHLKGHDFIVILNDNEMSISPSVGALSRYLNRVISNPRYNRLRDDIEALMQRLPRYGPRLLTTAKRLEEGVKHLLIPGLVFEELGFRYFGPIDGHNLPELLRTLENVKQLHGMRLIHVVTKKGKGYPPAERDPERFHKQDAFDLQTGRPKTPKRKSRPGVPGSFSEAFSQKLVELARRDERIVAITAAMPEGTGLAQFQRAFPERCFDVGMAEQHALGFATGLAAGGRRPVFAVYSTFLQRGYDQLFHEVALQRMPVVVAVDRAGIVGEDGPTHHGIFDIVYCRTLPNLTLAAPRCEEELELMLACAFEQSGPVVLRYARGKSWQPERGPMPPPPTPIVVGKAEPLRDGEDVAILALGSMVHPALEAASHLATAGIAAAVINARFIRPLDEDLLLELSRRYPWLVTVEEGIVEGGFGSAVAEALDRAGVGSDIHVRRLGLPTTFIEHAPREVLLAEHGLTPAGIAEAIRILLATAPPPQAPWNRESLIDVRNSAKRTEQPIA